MAHPPDLPRVLGLFMALGAVVALAGFAALALDLWPGLAHLSGPRVVSRAGADGVPELVVRQGEGGHYFVPGTVNGVDVDFLLDTGATNVGLPHALALRLGLERGVPVQIETASDVVPGYLVTLDRVDVGPLSMRSVRANVSERMIGGEVLLGMSFLRHFDLSQSDRTLTVRVPRRR